MYNNYTVKNVPVSLYAVTMLIFQIKRIISSEKWCNYAVIFLKMPKIWVGQTMVNREEKKGWPYRAEQNNFLECDFFSMIIKYIRLSTVNKSCKY